MATDTQQPIEISDEDKTLAQAKDFWDGAGKKIAAALGVLLLLIGGYFAYNKFVKGPKEGEGAEAMFKAEEYFRLDSLNFALNGDGRNPGFLKIAKEYDGTKAGDMAHFYAGSILLQQGKAAEAIKHLDEFESDAKQVQARALSLKGHALAELGKKDDALAAYKKAAMHFPEDKGMSSDYLFTAGLYAESIGKIDEAKDLYRKLKKDYAQTERGFEADKYLARLGELGTGDKD